MSYMYRTSSLTNIYFNRSAHSSFSGAIMWTPSCLIFFPSSLNVFYERSYLMLLYCGTNVVSSICSLTSVYFSYYYFLVDFISNHYFVLEEVSVPKSIPSKSSCIWVVAKKLASPRFANNSPRTSSSANNC